MPEIGFENLFAALLWPVAALWLLALLWTVYCLRRQKNLEISSVRQTPSERPFVSIIVPVRNEAGRILEKSVSSMLAQTYENFELIALDDRSTDDTRKVLEKLKIKNPKLIIVEGAETAGGWLGKPFALEQAFKHSKGEWILAADADIVFAPETLQTAVSYAEENAFDALTLVPRQIFGSFWERLFMPVFGWFCLLIMPLHRVNDPRKKASTGVGNFFMLRRAVLEKIGGFASVKAEVAEDLKLAEIIKSENFRLRVDYAEFIETRMYRGLGEIWQGFTKNLFSGMKFSVSKTVFGAASILFFGVLPPVLAAAVLIGGSFALFFPFAAAYFFQVLTFFFVNRRWRGSAFYALLAPAGLALFLLILINSARRVLSGKGVEWKGRAIYEKGGVRPPAG
jgi:chlorobactene glucosyltransferase